VGTIIEGNIETTEAPLWAFEDARCERASRSQKGNRAFSIWWRDLYVCDFSDYRLLYRVTGPQASAEQRKPTMPLPFHLSHGNPQQT